MLLAIDIGNTHTVAAVYDAASRRADWRFATKRESDSRAISDQLLADLQRADISPRHLTSLGLASVVPSLTQPYAEAAEKDLRIPAVVIDGSLNLGIHIRYSDPMAVGADRICNAVAGFAKYGGPLIIVDFGTATTYDVVARNGDYLGGVIAPGVETSAADLHRRAARLPQIELQLPEELIAQDTISSMQAGILYGAIDSTEGMVRRLHSAIEQAEGFTPRVIGTGGFSRFIADHSGVLEHLEPHLVLDGIRLISEKVLGKS